MPRIKILFVIPSLNNGGSERVISTLVNNIDPSVFEPILMDLNAQEQFFPIDKSRVRYLKFENQRIKNSFSLLQKIVSAERPQIVVSTLSHLNLMVAMNRFRLPRDIRFVARESSVMSINNQNQPQPRLYNFLTRLFYRRFDRIICQSADMKTDFLSHFKIPEIKLVVVNNPVNVADIAEKSLEKIADFENLPLSKIRFVTVGRLDFPKGVDRILTVLSQLDFDFIFDIIGDGSEMESLKNMAKSLKINDKVTFQGALKNPFPYIAAADIFLFGSRHEGFPNVLIEAGACGVPVVTFKCKGGIDEIIVDGENGFAVPDGNFIAFENAVRRVLSVDFDRQKIRRMTAERFGQTKILKEYEAVFLDLAASHISQKHYAKS